MITSNLLLIELSVLEVFTSVFVAAVLRAVFTVLSAAVIWQSQL